MTAHLIDIVSKDNKDRASIAILILDSFKITSGSVIIMLFIRNTDIPTQVRYPKFLPFREDEVRQIHV